jgi:hypothetical protein
VFFPWADTRDADSAAADSCAHCAHSSRCDPAPAALAVGIVGDRGCRQARGRRSTHPADRRRRSGMRWTCGRCAPTALSMVILATSALVTWTTDIAEVAPATTSWCRWPRAGRCPIEDWSVTVASPLRTLPMLIDELQVVKAVRQLRAKPTPRSRVHQLRLAANRRRRRPRHREDDGEFASSRLDHPSWRDRGVHHFGWQMMVHG